VLPKYLVEALFRKQQIEEKKLEGKYEHETVENTVLKYLSLKGDKRFTTGVPIRLIEFNRLTFFWDKLGLNKFDLEKCDPKWCDEIYQVHLGVENYKSNEMKKASSGSAQSANMGGKQRQVTKLL